MNEQPKMNIKFSPPDIGEKEIESVISALRSGWITTGPKVKQFEKNLAQYVGSGFGEDGTPRCVCRNSQTACSEMALRLLGVGEGDEVIVPAYTYTATASVVCHVGAKIVMVDIQKDNPEMDYDALERAITEKTKVVIPVDLGGVPCDYDKIFQIVERKRKLFVPANDLQKAIGRVVVLADTAHALGAVWKDKKIGSVADFSSFSFHAVKNLTTAEGGALTWKKIHGISDDSIYRKLQLFSLHGQNKDAFHKNQPGAWEYDIIGTWYKCNMTDIVAAIGLAQLERYDSMLQRRKEIIEKYDAAFADISVCGLTHFTDKHRSSGHLYISRVIGADDLKRRQIIIKMAENGIACNVHYKPLPVHTAYKNLGFNISDFPNAFAFYQNEITLPLHTKLTDDKVSYIIENYKKIIIDS